MLKNEKQKFGLFFQNKIDPPFCFKFIFQKWSQRPRKLQKRKKIVSISINCQFQYILSASPTRRFGESKLVNWLYTTHIYIRRRTECRQQSIVCTRVHASDSTHETRSTLVYSWNQIRNIQICFRIFEKKNISFRFFSRNNHLRRLGMTRGSFVKKNKQNPANHFRWVISGHGGISQFRVK